MKFSLRKTTGLQWVGFYLASLAALALLGWSEGALWLAAIVGGVALTIYWVAVAGMPVPVEEAEDFWDSIEDAPSTIDIGHINYNQ